MARGLSVGSIYKTKSFGDVKVINYKNAFNVDVVFERTGTVASFEAGHIRSGNIKDPMHPTVYGFGFIGIGVHKAHENRKSDWKYQCWKNMIKRCYGNDNDKTSPTYVDCTVCDEWRNYQNFAEWCIYNEPSSNHDFFIDKDLKKLGNKVYSPDNCLFVSRLVNNFLTDRRARRGKYKIGASFCNRERKIIGNCRNPITGKQVYLGRFSNDDDANRAWVLAKSKFAIELSMMEENKDVAQYLVNYSESILNGEVHKH